MLWPMVAPESETEVEPGPRPTFSVVIAAYNAALTIGEAIESALEQSEAPYEIVVCDDGSTDDIEGAISAYRAGLIFLRKPNGGGASALNVAADAARGDFVSILDADDAYTAGRLKALAVKGPRRVAALPEVPTLRELGLPEMEGARSYYAILAPAGTPASLVQRLNGDIVQIVKQPSFAEKVTTMGLEVAATSSEELAANLREDLDRYGALARRADLKRK